jgi:hypothetical protein
MPALIPWSGFTGTTPNADEFQEGLVSTSAADESFDILNGGLTEEFNWDGGGEASVPLWAVQPGAWAAGYYYGFDRKDFVYVKQDSQVYEKTGVARAYGLLASLTHTLFIPFDAEVVIFGYQAFCAQQCDQADIVNAGHRFYLEPFINGVEFAGIRSPLPHTSDATTLGGVDSDFENNRLEYRFRQSGATGMLKAAAYDDATGQDKGRFRFDLLVYGDIEDDDKDPRVTVVTGGFWALALR